MEDTGTLAPQSRQLEIPNRQGGSNPRLLLGSCGNPHEIGERSNPAGLRAEAKAVRSGRAWMEGEASMHKKRKRAVR